MTPLYSYDTDTAGIAVKTITVLALIPIKGKP
jgi:hypothetical protein